MSGIIWISRTIVSRQTNNVWNIKSRRRLYRERRGGGFTSFLQAPRGGAFTRRARETVRELSLCTWMPTKPPYNGKVWIIGMIGMIMIIGIIVSNRKNSVWEIETQRKFYKGHDRDDQDNRDDWDDPNNQIVVSRRRTMYGKRDTGDFARTRPGMIRIIGMIEIIRIICQS